MGYGNQMYGTTSFGSDGNGGDQPKYTKPDLMRYLPEYYQSVREMKALQGMASDELGLFLFAMDDVLKQCFVDTATWGLSLWENELEIQTDQTKPYARRREQIKAKIRGSGTTTKQMIIDTAMAFSGGEVDVHEYPAESRFEIQFIGVLGIPSNMAGFIAMIEQIKPAHLAYSFKYTYTTWAMLRNLTWADAGAKTWNQLRTYEGA